MIKDSVFREYDIRGVAGTDLTEEFAYLLGRAYAVLVQAQFGTGPKTVAVGRDCRLSGPALSEALINGINAGGVNVIASGMGPTPQLYYVVVAKKLDGGIQVTGSHNPGDQNGFKMMIGTRTLSGPDIQKLKSLMKDGASLHAGPEKGRREDWPAQRPYIEELVTRSQDRMGARPLKIVVDGGNGVGGLVGPELLRRLGCEVIELYTEPDGRFPNHHPDPTVMENLEELRSRVVQENADCGIAWDGDADRIGVVDDNGEPVFGDKLLILYGRQLLTEVAHPTIIADVKCSQVMFDDLSARGAKTVIAKTGHSLIKAKLKELHAELAGEMSGHMFFVHRYFGFDDALHASARLVEILSASSATISEMLNDLPKTVSTPELRVDCPEEIKFQLAEGAKAAFPEYPTNTLDGVRVQFEHGWGLVRASNTQPALVMRFEADSQERLEEYREIVEGRIEKLRGDLG